MLRSQVDRVGLKCCHHTVPHQYGLDPTKERNSSLEWRVVAYRCCWLTCTNSACNTQALQPEDQTPTVDVGAHQHSGVFQPWCGNESPTPLHLGPMCTHKWLIYSTLLVRQRYCNRVERSGLSLLFVDCTLGVLYANRHGPMDTQVLRRAL